MHGGILPIRKSRIAGLAAMMAVPCLAGEPAPYTIEPTLFDHQAPDLGLAPAPGTQTVTIFAPGPDRDSFNNGAVLIEFGGRLLAQWQSSAKDEDSPDTRVLYAVSDDGLHWSAPVELAPAAPGATMHSNGGWWRDGEHLVAFVNVWPDGFNKAAGGYTAYMTSGDGEHWSAMARVTGAGGEPVEGVIEQDPHLYDGRLFTAFHERPGIVAKPYFTDDPLGLRGWTQGRMDNLPVEGTMSREIEPSLFAAGDCLIMVFRDQASSYRQLAAESCDRGETWSIPVLTGMPDARAKQSAGNLPDGTAFIATAVNDDKLRIPLAVTLSAEGRQFTRSFLLRGEADLQPLRVEGRYKRPGYHYPKSLVAGGYLYVAYATNKEDIELTRVPLESLVP